MTEDDLKRIEAECYYIGTVYGYEYTSEPEQLVQAYRALKKENDELLTELLTINRYK